ALFAAVVCLSLRGGEQVGAVGNLQGDGTSTAARHHQSGDDRDLGARTMARLAWTCVPIWLVCVRLASGQDCACSCAVGSAWAVGPLGEGFCCRRQSAFGEVL